MKPDQTRRSQQGELARFKLPRTRGVRCLCGWRFIAKYAFATILVRAFAFVGEQHRDRRPAVDLLHPARLFVQRRIAVSSSECPSLAFRTAVFNTSIVRS